MPQYTPRHRTVERPIRWTPRARSIATGGLLSLSLVLLAGVGQLPTYLPWTGVPAAVLLGV